MFSQARQAQLGLIAVGITLFLSLAVLAKSGSWQASGQAGKSMVASSEAVLENSNQTSAILAASSGGRP